MAIPLQFTVPATVTFCVNAKSGAARKKIEVAIREAMSGFDGKKLVVDSGSLPKPVSAIYGAAILAGGKSCGEHGEGTLLLGGFPTVDNPDNLRMVAKRKTLDGAWAIYSRPSGRKTAAYVLGDVFFDYDRAVEAVLARANGEPKSLFLLRGGSTLWVFPTRVAD